jgi:hypothetical protein
MMGRNQQTWTLKALPDVPAAEGKVEVATGGHGNRDLKVKVEHLALPAEVFQGTSTYVVWLTPTNGQPQNVGVLKVSDKRKGELKTNTTFTSFNITVTAEASPDATTPSPHAVMNAQVEVAT